MAALRPLVKPKIVKKRTQSDRCVQMKRNWRKPEALTIGGPILMPSVGYGATRKQHRLPSGSRRLLVPNVKELEAPLTCSLTVLIAHTSPQRPPKPLGEEQPSCHQATNPDARLRSERVN
uniref:60S ribosomal protein L32 n=1 Tax=Myotis lucifugus TaxID=59463 RepID=G1Q9B1_MYOLU